ncbi:MAG TPA: DNA recombination protein RmuC [Casimicrobiaceae bacterium]|nr:DNA recombination protein RmuC [Casimicrobiaceae bacterium]
MIEPILIALIAAGAALALIIVLMGFALGRLATLRTDLAVLRAHNEDLERDLKQDLASGRRDVGEGMHRFTDATRHQLVDATRATNDSLHVFAAQLKEVAQLMQSELRTARESQVAQAQAADERLANVGRTSEQRLVELRTTLEQRLDLLRNENQKKLDEMRATVDEKLQATLEARLGESFKLVSDRLDQVHKGLGEMQTLAQGVGDLKRVLSNVKSRGTWGEMQLGTLLADLLTSQQYGINVETIPGTNRRVEFAIRIPSGADEPPCWIPVDSKFPVEQWERLQAALDRADADAAESARKGLAQFARTQAKKVRESYVCPPHTSDFAFLFLPTESLYAELMSRAGLFDELQREYRVTLAGPSNFVAFLNVVQMGFQRVAIEQRSAEVWQLLGAVRTEFGKFGQMLSRVQKKLEEANNVLNDARGKTTTIERKLRSVEALPEPSAMRLLSSPTPFVLEPDEPPLDEK